MKSWLRRFYQQAHSAKSKLIFRFNRSHLQPRVRLKVPYVCQWESPKLAAVFLSDPAKTQTDPRWQQSGAATPEEYATWSWSLCGMACLKMILATRHKTAPALVTLGKLAAHHGVYELHNNIVEGMFYKPFVPFVQQEFGLRARIKTPLHLFDILSALHRGYFVIASVSPAIRWLGTAPPTVGGHLVLIVGYDMAGQQLFLHNPSGDTAASQPMPRYRLTYLQTISRAAVLSSNKKAGGPRAVVARAARSCCSGRLSPALRQLGWLGRNGHNQPLGCGEQRTHW